MLRGAILRVARAGVLAAATGATGCSLVLDFDQPADAAPPDAPVSVEQCAAHEPNDQPGMATSWVGVDLAGAICGNGDVDLFAITLVAGQSVMANITFQNRGGSGDLDLRLLTADGGSVLDESRGSSDTETVMCPGGAPCPAITGGTYLIEVRGFMPSVQSAYSLNIVTPPVP